MNPTEETPTSTNTPDAESTVINVKTSSADTQGSTSVEISDDGTLSTGMAGSKVTPEESTSSKPTDTIPKDEDMQPKEETTQTEVSSSEPSNNLSSSEPSVSENNNLATENNPMAIPPQQPKKSGKPKAAIIVAVLIVISLIAVSVVAFMKMNTKQKTTPATTTQTETKTEQKTEVTSQDVEAASTDIDTEINKTDDAKDLPTAESVNDQTLGL